ncbi:Concanavalin A-like lectin/glucanase [Beauveria brongniartii RCEF 3172]|uniref:Concanavalin A-like lectin/glucanase n=1 Tax=Beauveria brongniartii RCEF 3172 TaxID=1081107 RepID=A0A167BUG8_9HYPO|nr:Concanavalin A-like lectin/glucanase [Beauveria brongniartii RCEF 3172]
MKYSLILSSLATLAAAVPAVTRGVALRQREPSQRQRSQFKKPSSNVTETQYSSNWAGVVQIGNGYNHVQGTIVVPSVSGGADSAASAWVGIDGDTCQSAILQTGVSFYGDGSFDAWYEWIPDYSHSFSGIGISVGDSIKMYVDASSKTGGVAVLENLTTGKTVQHKFTSPPSTLCETNAEWIVEDFKSGGSLVPFANFGSITFTDASASGSQGSITPSGGTVIDLRTTSGQILTDCGTSGSDVYCNYTG